MLKYYHGQLEVDEERGVVYFHLDPLHEDNAELSNITTATLLRVQGLNVNQLPSPQHQLDIRTGLYQEARVVS